MAGKRVGLDAIAILVNSDKEQLRASAITRLDTLRAENAASVSAADEAYRATEAEYLEAVTAWKRATPAERGAAATRVGELQRTLEHQDTARQEARYPHRHIQQKELYRNVIDPDTRDMRKIPFPVFVNRTAATDAKERSILL